MNVRLLRRLLPLLLLFCPWAFAGQDSSEPWQLPL
jgi:hypothetical protein